MKLLKDLTAYIENMEAINNCYRYGLKHSYCHDETYSWRQRLEFWQDCMAHDGYNEQEVA